MTRDDIIALADTFARSTGLARSTLSTRVFQDGKVIDRLMRGGDLTTLRAAKAGEWFAAHWPDGIEWPPAVVRPHIEEAAE